MSAPNDQAGTPLQVLAAAQCDGGRLSTVVQIIASTIIDSIVRTQGQGAGSFDLGFIQAMPTGKASVQVLGDAIGQTHNRSPDYQWIDASTLRVTFRDDTGALADPAIFSVRVRRCAQ